MQLAYALPYIYLIKLLIDRQIKNILKPFD